VKVIKKRLSISLTLVEEQDASNSNNSPKLVPSLQTVEDCRGTMSEIKLGRQIRYSLEVTRKRCPTKIKERVEQISEKSMMTLLKYYVLKEEQSKQQATCQTTKSNQTKNHHLLSQICSSNQQLTTIKRLRRIMNS